MLLHEHEGVRDSFGFAVERQKVLLAIHLLVVCRNLLVVIEPERGNPARIGDNRGMKSHGDNRMRLSEKVDDCGGIDSRIDDACSACGIQLVDNGGVHGMIFGRKIDKRKGKLARQGDAFQCGCEFLHKPFGNKAVLTQRNRNVRAGFHVVLCEQKIRCAADAFAFD